MATKRIFRANYAEERVWIESSGRYEVTGIREAKLPDDDGDIDMFFKPIARRRRRVSRVKPTPGVSGWVEYSGSRKVARRIFDLTTPASRKAPKQIADQWLKRFSNKLGIDKRLSGLISKEDPKTSIFGKHVLYQQYVGKTQISGAWIRVDIDTEGRVFNIQNDIVPAKVLDKQRRGARTRSRLKADEGLKIISGAEAGRRALARIPVKRGGEASVSRKRELVYLPSGVVPLLSWKLVIRCTKPRAVYKAYVDASSGEFLWLQNLIKSSTGRAWVFDPNPMATLNRKLTNRSDIPDAAYREVTLRGLGRSGYLDGPYVSTKLTKRRVRRPSGDFKFRRGEQGFTEAMVYFHIDRVQRHLQALGFVKLLDKAIKVNASANDDDQSYYLFDDRSLRFGRGGVDDAEDAEVILHEYGHALQDAQVPGWGESMEAGAMGEGFGDFLATSFFADWKPSAYRTLFASWDGYAGDPPVRRLDTHKRYPGGVVGEVHDDGEIWSACLWELRDAIGRAAAEKLVIAHHYLLNRWAGFEEAAEAMLTTDRQLFGGRYRQLIRNVFERRGVLLRP